VSIAGAQPLDASGLRRLPLVSGKPIGDSSRLPADGNPDFSVRTASHQASALLAATMTMGAEPTPAPSIKQPPTDVKAKFGEREVTLAIDPATPPWFQTSVATVTATFSEAGRVLLEIDNREWGRLDTNDADKKVAFSNVQFDNGEHTLSFVGIDDKGGKIGSSRATLQVGGQRRPSGRH